MVTENDIHLARPVCRGCTPHGEKLRNALSLQPINLGSSTCSQHVWHFGDYLVLQNAL